jgi:hypothetical protein
MAPHTSSVAVTTVAPIIERRHAVRRESVRDFVGVGIGVAVGALLWATLFSFARLSS